MAISVGPPALLLIAVVFLVFSSLVNAASFEYCNKRANYAVKVTGIEIHPDPVKGGEPAQFKILATTENAIPKGNVVIDVKYFFLHVYSETKDLCTETSCPVAAGDFVLAHEQSLPSLTPPGSYYLTMKIYGENGQEQLSCISFGFSIGFMSSVASLAAF